MKIITPESPKKRLLDMVTILNTTKDIFQSVITVLTQPKNNNE